MILEPDRDEMLAMGRDVLDAVVDHVASLGAQPSHGLDGAVELARALREDTAPATGTPLHALLETLMPAISRSLNSAGPGYLAYIPGGGLYAAALADFLACAVNRYVGTWGTAPPLVQLEANVVRWMCAIMGYPTTAFGILTTGGSLANLSAIITARATLGEHFWDGCLYVTEQAHRSTVKAARLAGFPAAGVRLVAVDENQRMDVAHLTRLMADDRAAGRRPFLIVASAGTTSTGAIDPLPALADLSSQEKLWLHVDGAFGGFFMLTERGRAALSGIERADSITLDPHKSLFLPFGTGALLVRDGGMLARAHSTDGAYLQDLETDDPDAVSFCDMSPELSRDFRGLRVWLPVKLYGLDAFRDALDEKIDLALYAYERLTKMDGFEVLHRPVLPLVAFRHRGDDAFNRELMRRCNDDLRVVLSSTVVDGKFTLRICPLNFRTHRDRVDDALASLQRHARELAATEPA